MATGISNDYGQFYRGTEQIASYGSSAGAKDTLVRYEFNTTDEKGNKVMDKMTREETYRTMNEIASQYGDNVIVEFSGDALTSLEQYGKGLYRETATNRKDLEVEYLEGAHALTEEEMEAINTSKLGDDMIAIMRDVDPDAYQEYQRISKEGIASGTKEGMVAGFRYEINWIVKKAKENPNWLENYKRSQKTETNTTVKGSESKLSGKAAAYLEKLRKTYGDFEFIVGSADDDLRSLVKNSSKEFSVIFSSDELEKMASDEKYAKEKMDAVHSAVRMSKQINEQFGFEGTFGNARGSKITKIAISFNEDGSVSYFAELEKSLGKQKERIEKLREKQSQEKKETARKEKQKKEPAATKKVTVEASSQEELIRKIKQIDWSEAKTENRQVTGSKFDYSI